VRPFLCGPARKSGALPCEHERFVDTAAALNPGHAMARRGDKPLTASLVVSVVLHAGMLLRAGAALRPLPAAIVAAPGTPLPLRAMLVAVQSTESRRVPEQAEPMREQPSPLPPIVLPPVRAARGLSMTPTNVAADPVFISAGRIAVGNSLDPRDFDAAITALLAERYPYTPARLPRLVGGLPVLYPLKAARAGTNQRIKMLLLLDANGTILQMQSAPEDPLFAAAVVAALRNAQFAPASFEGKPVPYWAILDFRFDIDGPTGPDDKPLK
jgi:hypothetical protein